ncbi:DUF3237 domain-containing protein [Nonomuraea africana]|uniref:DUF3237 domain-containing protein n=1 Tax=Nonomuraea africana TaxID=46171 RepID=UPI0033E92541
MAARTAPAGTRQLSRPKDSAPSQGDHHVRRPRPDLRLRDPRAPLPHPARRTRRRRETEFTPIIGGTVDGPWLRGVVLPGGGDWSNTRGRVCELDARYLLQTEDGAVIDVVNRGYYHEGGPSPDQYDGDLQVSKAGVYYRTSPAFRPAHRWLAETVFVGLAREAETGVVAIRMYAVA